MYKEKPEFVTHCPRGHPRKFQFIKRLSKIDMHILLFIAEGDTITSHSTLHTPHSTLHTPLAVLQTPRFTLTERLQSFF